MPDTPDVDAKDWAIINGACADADLLRIQERGLNPRSNGAHRYRNAAHRQQAALAAANARADAAIREAQTWKQEAMTQRATVHAAYEICTGKTGEPGDWNGAEPIRALAARADEAEAVCEWLAEEVAALNSGTVVIYSDGSVMRTAQQWLAAARNAVREAVKR